MTRIDLVVLQVMLSRILLAIGVFFGLIVLVESIDSWRFNYLMSVGGLPMALLGIVTGSAVWLLRGLTVVVLVGAVAGVIDLQARRELTIIKAAGTSIWKVLRAPALVLLLAGLAVTLVVQDAVVSTNRGLDATIGDAAENAGER